MKWKGKAYRLVIQRQKRLDGVLDLWDGEYTYHYILTNDYESSVREIVEFYNLRGGKERIFDDMNNGFGWDRLPKFFMAENTVFLLLTALRANSVMRGCVHARRMLKGLVTDLRITYSIFSNPSTNPEITLLARCHLELLDTANFLWLIVINESTLWAGSYLYSRPEK